MTWTARAATLAVITTVGLALAGCSVGTSGSITVTAKFDNANGLFVGNAVSVLGMRVGKVDGIRAYGTHVDVTMSVDKSIEIPASAQAVIISDSILTDRHVEFTPVYRSGPTLPDHSVLDLDHTKTPVEFDSLLSMADKLSKSLEGNEGGQGPIADLMGLGSAITTNNGDSMRSALSELSKALQLGGDNGTATRDAITRIVDNLSSLTAVAARNDQTLREFGSGIRQLSDILADLNLGAGNTGTKLDEIIVQVTDLMQKNRANLKSMTSNSNVMTKTLADYNDNLAEFLDVFPLVTDNAYNAVNQHVGALRVGVDLNKILLDGQMLKEACNLLGLKQLGCATGRMQDMGPDFGVTEMLQAMAGMPKK